MERRRKKGVHEMQKKHMGRWMVMIESEEVVRRASTRVCPCQVAYVRNEAEGDHRVYVRSVVELVREGEA